MKPYATSEFFEYWLHAGEIYRNAIGNRGPRDLSAPGMPMGTRWECSLAHFERYYLRAGRAEKVNA